LLSGPEKNNHCERDEHKNEVVHKTSLRKLHMMRVKQKQPTYQ
jgi:hypothetical protein